jgi:hypothetical protein
MQQRNSTRLAELSRAVTRIDKHFSKSTPPSIGAPQHPLLDTTAMIRSLQRSEGVEDCYRRGHKVCDYHECPWRRYCLTS